MTETQRFWLKVDKTSTCWNWTASLTNTYGAFRLSKENTGKLVRANRYSYELHYGHIPHGLIVCHSCDNRLCVNPHHLFLGSYKQNTADMIKKNRHFKPKLTLEQVKEIRFRYNKENISQKALGLEYNISQGMVHFIINKVQWK